MNRAERMVRRGYRVIAFLGYFGYQFLRSNLVVAGEILTPGSGLAPAIIELRLRCRTRLEIVSLANLVNLTPGTLSLQIRVDPPALYVHGMHAGDVAAFRHRLRNLEDRMLAAMRPVGGEGARCPPSGR
jgi:multicomponent Na+:H+ antiporter subunit E